MMERMLALTCLSLSVAACGPTVEMAEDDGPASTTSTTPTTSTTATTIPTTTTTSTTAAVTTAPPPPLDSTSSTGFPPPIFDDWFLADLPPPCSLIGPRGLPGANLNYLWVANTPEGTLSKIDTQSLVEVARYLTAPSPSTPSNVSVALSGAAVVANEDGGITKVHAIDCPDPFNTSTGPGDVYAWPDDGCLAWSTPMAGSTTAIAWAPGTYNEGTCEWEDELLWTTEYFGGTAVDVHLVDGETGTISASAQVLSYPGGMGPRTGAVDSEGNFWFIPRGPGPLVRVDIMTLAVDQWDLPAASVGVAVDPMLGVWTCGAAGLARFDIGPGMFTTFDTIAMGTGPINGCASDGLALWLSGSNAAWSFRFDSETIDFMGVMPDPVQGVAVDYSGAIWFAADGDTRMHRLLPPMMQIGTVEGLQNPTAQSDMTGYALAHVTN